MTAQKYSSRSRNNCMNKLYISVYRILSISSRDGMEFAVPILVVDKPAVALANIRESLIFCPSVNAAAKPALKASPAPVVSNTGFERLAIGRENGFKINEKWCYDK